MRPTRESTTDRTPEPQLQGRSGQAIKERKRVIQALATLTAKSVNKFEFAGPEMILYRALGIDLLYPIRKLSEALVLCGKAVERVVLCGKAVEREGLDDLHVLIVALLDAFPNSPGWWIEAPDRRDAHAVERLVQEVLDRMTPEVVERLTRIAEDLAEEAEWHWSKTTGQVRFWAGLARDRAGAVARKFRSYGELVGDYRRLHKAYGEDAAAIWDETILRTMVFLQPADAKRRRKRMKAKSKLRRPSRMPPVPVT